MSIHTSLANSKAAIFGMGFGILFMAFFGALWAVTGIIGLQGWGYPYVLIVPTLIGGMLIAGGISLLLKAKKLPAQTTVEAVTMKKKMGFWFNIIFIIQGISIGITIALCNALHQTHLIPFIIAIIVGLHFFPLAVLYQIRLYYVTGGLLCLIPCIALLLGSAQLQLGEYNIIVPLSLLGFGSAVVLWTNALYFWRSVKI